VRPAGRPKMNWMHSWTLTMPRYGSVSVSLLAVVILAHSSMVTVRLDELRRRTRGIQRARVARCLILNRNCPVLGGLVWLKISARTGHRYTYVHRSRPSVFGSHVELGNRSRVSSFSTCRPGNPKGLTRGLATLLPGCNWEHLVVKDRAGRLTSRAGRPSSHALFLCILFAVQGSHASWKVLDFFFLENSRTWKVLKNHFSPGN